MTGPVTHSYSGTKHYYVAQGILQRWDVKTQKLIPVLPLHNHNRTVFTSASTSLLKDGLEAVKQAEERQAPQLRPAVLPSSEKPAAQPSSGSASPETDGTASITSTPDGAEIFVDSVGRGHAPALLKLKPGKHTVQLVMDGYKDFIEEIELKAGSIVNITGNLQK